MTQIEVIRLFFEIIGALTTVIGIILLFTSIISWIMGVYPLFLRLGFGRWNRKIDIVADDTNYRSIKSDLVETGIFRKKNINQISSMSLSNIKNSNLALIHYQSFKIGEVKNILSNKKPKAGFIFYFPEFNSSTNKIPDDIRDLINNEQFTTVVNFRGRLINDVVTTLLSTSYDKK